VNEFPWLGTNKREPQTGSNGEPDGIRKGKKKIQGKHLKTPPLQREGVPEKENPPVKVSESISAEGKGKKGFRRVDPSKIILSNPGSPSEGGESKEIRFLKILVRPEFKGFSRSGKEPKAKQKNAESSDKNFLPSKREIYYAFFFIVKGPKDAESPGEERDLGT